MSIIDITDYCSLDCIYCCRGKGEEQRIELDNTTILDMVSQINKLRGTFLVVQGGEPLLKRDIVELIQGMGELKESNPGEYLELIKSMIACRYNDKKLNLTYMKNIIQQNLPLYCLTTNGMIYRDEIEEALYQNGFYLEISLDAPVEEINLKTRPGIKFDQVVDNIRSFSKRLPVEISCTITENNVDYLPDMIPFAHDLGCVCLKLSPVIMIGCRMTPDSLWVEKYLQSIEESIETHKELLGKMLLKVKLYRHLIRSGAGLELYNKLRETPNVLIEVHECTALKKVKDIYVDTRLDVYGCASMKNEKELVIGNLKESSLKDIWHSAKKEGVKKEVEAHECHWNDGDEYTCTAVAYSQNRKEELATAL